MYSALDVQSYVDLNKNELRNARVQNLGSAPSSPVEGQIYYDTVSHALYWWDGNVWQLSTGTVTSYGTVTAETSYGQSSSNGVASSVSRSDHTHGTPSLTTNAASTQAIGDSASAGTGTLPAKDDHKHAMPGFGNVSGQTSFGASSGNGSAASVARSDHTHGTPTHDATAHSGISISSLSAATGTYSFGANLVQSSATPTTSNDLTNKQYVDSVAAGLRDFKDSVKVATTAAGTLATSFANGQSVDGYTLVTGDRILIKNQAAGEENGIYVVKASGAPDRATDADANGEISTGTMVYVEGGTANGAQQWICSATGATPWVAGSSTSTWVMYFAVTATQAGNGLTASANILAVGAGTGISVGADTVGIDTSVVARKYIAGTGPSTDASSWAITHSLNNRDVAVQVYDASTYAVVNCDVTLTDANTVTLNFGSSITANTLRAVVVG